MLMGRSQSFDADEAISILIKPYARHHASLHFALPPRPSPRASQTLDRGRSARTQLPHRLRRFVSADNEHLHPAMVVAAPSAHRVKCGALGNHGARRRHFLENLLMCAVGSTWSSPYFASGVGCCRSAPRRALPLSGRLRVGVKENEQTCRRPPFV
jgi:hypothetical protein